MNIKIICSAALTMAISIMATGCASTYGNLVSGNKLGANTYQPAVYVPPNDEAKYHQVLAICRQVAAKREVTAAQQAQLHTITGAVQGTTSGAAAGLQMGSILSEVGDNNASIGEDAGIGAAAGLIASLGSAFASGTSHDASATRRILLRCLQKMAPSVGYTVLEQP